MGCWFSTRDDSDETLALKKQKKLEKVPLSHTHATKQDFSSISEVDSVATTESGDTLTSLSSAESSAHSLAKEKSLAKTETYDEQQEAGEAIPHTTHEEVPQTTRDLQRPPSPKVKPVVKTLPKDFKLSEAREEWAPREELHLRKRPTSTTALEKHQQKPVTKPKQRPASKTLKPSKFTSTRPKCPLCGKTAYAAESVEYNKVMYHKICFKCVQCRIKLSVHSISPADGKFYCKRCFNAVKIAKGNQQSTKRDDYTASQDVILEASLQSGQSVKDRYIQEYSVNMHKRSMSREQGIKEHRMSTVVGIDQAKKEESSKLIEKILLDKQQRGLENQLKITSGDSDSDSNPEDSDPELSEKEMENEDLVEKSFDLPQRPRRKATVTKRKKKKAPKGLNLNNNAGEFKRLTPSQFEEKTQEIVQLIDENKRMEVMSMSNCSLGNDFVAKIVPALCENTTITELNLESNNLSGPAYRHLAKLLLHNKTLQVLKLRNQTMRPGHAIQKEFLEAIEKNTTLRTLGFDFNQKHQNDLKRKYLDRNLELRRIERNKLKAENADSKMETEVEIIVENGTENGVENENGVKNGVEEQDVENGGQIGAENGGEE